MSASHTVAVAILGSAALAAALKLGRTRAWEGHEQSEVAGPQRSGRVCALRSKRHNVPSQHKHRRIVG